MGGMGPWGSQVGLGGVWRRLGRSWGIPVRLGAPGGSLWVCGALWVCMGLYGLLRGLWGAVGSTGSVRLYGAPWALWISTASMGLRGAPVGSGADPCGGSGDTHGGEKSAEALLGHLQLEGAPEGRAGPWGQHGVRRAPGTPRGATLWGHTLDGEDLLLQLLLDPPQRLEVVHVEDVCLWGGRGDGLQLRGRLGVLEGAAHLRGNVPVTRAVPLSHSCPRALEALGAPGVLGVPPSWRPQHSTSRSMSPVPSASPQREAPPALCLSPPCPHGLSLTRLSPAVPGAPALPMSPNVRAPGVRGALRVTSLCPALLAPPQCTPRSVSPARCPHRSLRPTLRAAPPRPPRSRCPLGVPAVSV